MGLELIEIDGSKLIDLYLGAEVYTQFFQKNDAYLPVGILASTTLPSIVDLSFRTGYDFHQDRYYVGISLGRNISKHTRPAGEKIPYPDNFQPVNTLYLTRPRYQSRPSSMARRIQPGGRNRGPI